MPVQIRPATLEDAEAVSALIITTLRLTNSHDYSLKVIEAVAENFAPNIVANFIASRSVWVASHANEILATASLDGDVVRSVFVLPFHQGKGLGRQLMKAIIQRAHRNEISVLKVPASVTAEGFYRRLGFYPVREAFYGEERTLVMECAI